MRKFKFCNEVCIDVILWPVFALIIKLSGYAAGLECWIYSMLFIGALAIGDSACVLTSRIWQYFKVRKVVYAALMKNDNEVNEYES